METESTTFSDHVVRALRKAATEIEELKVQASLGKAEAKDKYEDLKKQFNGFVHDTKTQINKGKDAFQDLHQKLDELKVQLTLGKAETLEAFQEQKKKILHAVHELEVKIKTNPTVNRIYAVLLIELEKLKVQLEWLEEKMKEGADKAADSFEKQKEAFNDFVKKLGEKFSKEKEEKTRWEHFQTEISTAFTHLKSAIKKP